MKLIILLFLSGCSLLSSISVKTMGPVFRKATLALEGEQDFETFQAGSLANLKLLEGILISDPRNEDILLALVKGYGGYAYVVEETTYFEQKLSEEEDELQVRKIISQYSRAMEYGLRYLEEQGMNAEEIILKQKEGTLKEYFNKNLSRNPKNLEAMFFIGQSWGGLVNIQKKNPLMISQLGVVKEIFDWVCEEKNYLFGSCDLFYGIYEVSRPPLLGGNHQLGKNHFLTAIKNNPENLFARLSYIQWYLVPKMEEEEYFEQMEILEAKLKKFYHSFHWNPLDPKKKFPKRLNIYNSLAHERFLILKDYEKEMF